MIKVLPTWLKDKRHRTAHVRGFLTAALMIFIASVVVSDEPRAESESAARERIAIRELVRQGAIVKKFEVRETETKGLLVRLKSDHLDRNGGVAPLLLPYLAAIQDLAIEFRGLRLSDAGVREFLRSVQPLGLDLSGTDVTTRGVQPLGDAESLRLLDLSQTRVDAAGIGSLTKLRELRHLSLIGCEIGDEALPALSRLTGLRELYLSQTQMSATACEQLRMSVSRCRVVR